MTQDFETGLSTHAANDVALTVQNDGEVYRTFKAFAGSGEQRRLIRNACRTYGLLEYGRSFSDFEIDECVDYVWRMWTHE